MLKSRAKELAKEESQAKMDADYVGMFKCRRCGKNEVHLHAGANKIG
jgi:hypothetical protein